MGLAEERRLLDEHGTKLCELKPVNIVQAAEADLKLRERKARYEEAPRAPYAFHRVHVRKATGPRELIDLALQDSGIGEASGKRNTRLIYGTKELLRRALEILGGGAVARPSAHEN